MCLKASQIILNVYIIFTNKSIFQIIFFAEIWVISMYAVTQFCVVVT